MLFLIKINIYGWKYHLYQLTTVKLSTDMHLIRTSLFPTRVKMAGWGSLSCATSSTLTCTDLCSDLVTTSTICLNNNYSISINKLGIACRRAQSGVLTFLSMMSWTFDQSQRQRDSRWRPRHLLLVFGKTKLFVLFYANFRLELWVNRTKSRVMTP